jgi:zinc protease
VRPLVEKWLGSLPSGGRVEHAPDVGARRVPGPAAVTVSSGTEPKAHVRISYSGEFENDPIHRNRLMATSDVLAVLLREDLREERSGVYGVNTWTQNEEFPTQSWELDIDFVCDPTRVKELTEAATAIAAKMRTEAVDPHYIADEREKNVREREEQLRDDDFWIRALATALENGEDPGQILTWNQRNDSLTPEVVRDAAKIYLDPANRKIVTRMPAP